MLFVAATVAVVAVEVSLAPDVVVQQVVLCRQLPSLVLVVVGAVGRE